MLTVCLNSSYCSCSRSEKSCPNCCRATQIDQWVRIRFDLSLASTVDPADLERQLDDTALKLRLQSQELKNLKDEYKEAIKFHVGLNKHLKDRNYLLIKQLKKMAAVEEELESCKKKLLMMEGELTAVSTPKEVDQMPAECDDENELAESLSTQCVLHRR
jgi:hypothetical protein